MESSLFSNWKNKIVTFFSQAAKKINIHRSKYITGFAIVCTLVFVAFVGQSYVKNQLNTVYHINIDGKKVGTVGDKKLVEAWLDEKKAEQANRNVEASIEVDNNITIKEETGFKLAFNNESVLSQMQNLISFSATAVEVKIDGKVIGVVKDEQTVNKLLEEIKTQYAPVAKKDDGVRVASVSNATATPKDVQSNTSIVEEAKFVENIEVNKIKVLPADVLSQDELAELLAASETEKKVYNVSEGDCVGCIASKFNMSTKELLSLNPGLSEGSVLQLDQEITVSAAKPKLTVQTVETLKYNEDIPFLIQYVQDKELPKGQSKTVQEGKKGQKEVEVRIVKENGIEVNRTRLNETVITEPVVKIVKNGTKNVSRGTGTFGWPAVGGKITSSYGSRWGRLHKGLDIAGVKNRNILAADNGKIVSAGWDGAYGNAIVIDHGNGYKTRYAHLSKIIKKSGTVEKGDVIGVMGTTGRSTGVHLHFEIMKNEKQLNPSKFL